MYRLLRKSTYTMGPIIDIFWNTGLQSINTYPSATARLPLWTHSELFYKTLRKMTLRQKIIFRLLPLLFSTLLESPASSITPYVPQKSPLQLKHNYADFAQISDTGLVQ